MRVSTKLALGGPDVEWWETRAGIVRARRSACDVGPRLLFASDGPNVLEHYDGLLDALRGRADVVIYEPPGTGGSRSARDFGFRLSDFVRNAEEALEWCADVGLARAGDTENHDEFAWFGRLTATLT